MIGCEAAGPVAVVLLSRPEKRNALTPEMLELLRTAIERAVGSGARALVLGGEGPVFCGGFDLRMCLDVPGTLEALLRGLHGVIEDLRALPIPVVIAAQGAAIAGGCALLGGADVTVTNDDAKLGYPVTPLGISPAISAPFLRLLVGDGSARKHQLEPALMDGREAARIGLAGESVPTAAEVRPRAMEVARLLADKPPGAMAATRRWLAEVDATMMGKDEPSNALAASLSLVGSPEERERLTALFANPRTPR